jgi:DNA polymerase (family 10)
MPIHNTDIADIFDEIADYLDIEGDNPFRVRAYRNAARTVRAMGSELKDLVARGEDLTRFSGIGKELAAKIAEYVSTGAVNALKKLQDKIPAEVRQILKLPGLGPKRVRILYHDLNIRSLAQLQQAARDGRIRSLPGFGRKTEAQILKGIEAQAHTQKRCKIAEIRPYVDALLDDLKAIGGVNSVTVAGSYRRCRETVGDLDLLVVAAKNSTVMDRFVAYDDVVEVLANGTTKSSVVLRSGLQVDLRIVAPESFGAALQYFTGSQAHNIAMRQIGHQRGLKINEYGVFKFEEKVAGDSEASVYRAIGLAWVPPELRENQGEIEAAQAGALPQLVELADLKGDLHAHTDWSDGGNTLEEMLRAARNYGLKYLAITEHSDRLKIAGGLAPRRLLAQIDEIDRLNQRYSDITLLKGIEVEILADGRLDLSDDVLGRLDLVIGSIHSYFGLPLDKQTDRILRAMDHKFFSILAHPINRLIHERAPIEVDMPKVIQKARDRGCYLELNSNPRRLDLYDTYCRIAKEQGVLVAIDSDAHSVNSFSHLRYGVGQARRGWLEKDDVINTRPRKELKKLLKATMG